MREQDITFPERIKMLIAEQLHLDVNSITNDATLVSLGADSLDIMELIIKFEDEFSIEIDDAAAEQLHTVQEVITYLETMRAQKNS